MAGFLVGVLTSMAVLLSLFLYLLAEGSMGARIARLHETGAADLLRDVPGVHHVISNLEFDGFDVDCVVIAAGGVFAVETKAMTRIRPARQLDAGSRDRWGSQARANARKVRLLLRSHHIEVPVRPVMLLTGAGVPVDMPAFEEEPDGTLWVRRRDIDEWGTRIGSGDMKADEAERIRAAIAIYMDAFRPRDITAQPR